MAKVWKRGGARIAWENGELVVYADPAKLADVSAIDTPEVELVRVSKDEIQSEARRFMRNVQDELGRIKRRFSRRKAKK